jgi:hypothetical protein
LRCGDVMAVDSLAYFSSLEDVDGDTDEALRLPGLSSLELDAVFTFTKYVDLGIDILHTSGKTATTHQYRRLPHPSPN